MFVWYSMIHFRLLQNFRGSAMAAKLIAVSVGNMPHFLIPFLFDAANVQQCCCRCLQNQEMGLRNQETADEWYNNAGFRSS